MPTELMDHAALDDPSRGEMELPANAYPHHHRIFGSSDSPTGLLFDIPNFAVMSITHPPDSQTPDINTDKDGDRILILLDGDLVLRIGENRFRLGVGDAIRIPRGTRFGMTRSKAGAHLLLIRSKPPRSFALLR